MKKIFFSFILAIMTFTVFAQRQTTSPFTRFGYGDLYAPATVYHQSLGGASVGVCNPIQVNFANPASQAFIQKETFLFNVEAGASFRTLQEDGTSANTSSVGLESFSLAFPILPNRWGMAVGLLPFNSVGYDMTYTDDLATYSYNGDGGINQVMMSTGVRLFKGLAIGGNISYLFGTTEYCGENYFDNSYAYYSRKELTYKTKGLLAQTGLQYNWELSEDKSLTLGASFRWQQSLSYDAESYFGTYVTSNYIETEKDTVILKNTEDDTDIPMEIVFGMSYRTGNRYLFAFDCGLQQWEDVKIYDEKVDDELSQTKFVKVGCEIVPDYRSTKYLKRMPIRFGVRFSELPIICNNDTQIHELGFSLGTQIKSKQTQNSLAIGLDGGWRGNNSVAKSLNEKFVQIKLNVNLQEVWFTKRKIN